MWKYYEKGLCSKPWAAAKCPKTCDACDEDDEYMDAINVDQLNKVLVKNETLVESKTDSYFAYNM